MREAAVTYSRVHARTWMIVSAPSPASVLDRFRDVNPDDNFTFVNGKKAGDVVAQLKALTAPTKEQVDAIIGNESWTSIFCSGCSEYRQRAINFQGDCQVCEVCLQDALHALRSGKGRPGRIARR